MSAALLAAVDESTTAGAIQRAAGSADVALFDTGGNWLQVRRLIADLRSLGVQTVLVDAAALIHAQITELRVALPAWTDALADARIEGGTVAGELDCGLGTSVYWLGSLAERNPLKTPELLMAAVARAFDAELHRGGYAGAIVLLRPGLLAAALRGIAGAPDTADHAGGHASHAARGFAALARQAAWSMLARGLRLRRTPANVDVLCITYFPYVDREAAAEGRFVNRYAAGLQELFDAGQISVAWIALFVFIDGWTFRDAVALVRKFRASGTNIALLDSYGSPRLLMRVAADFRRVSRRAARIERALGDTLGRGLVPAGAGVIATALWRRSFAGLDLARSLLYFRIFERVVAETPAPRLALYFAEFQTWEQAFNASARRAGWRTAGFQHTVAAKNHYFYWRTPRETGRAGMPLPSSIAAGGELPAEAFRESGLPATVVESIRQLHVRSALDRGGGRAADDALLIAGSIDRRETLAMLSLAAAAADCGARAAMRVKAHPSMPAGPLISELGIDPSRFEIVEGAIAGWLERSRFVLVGSSAVAVEALAHGCDVLVPVLASAPCLSPLAGWEELYRPIRSPEELASALSAPPAAGETIEARRQFVRRYWALDAQLPRWRQLLRGN